MFLTPPRVLTVHYTLKDKTGGVIESSAGGDPLVFLEGGGQIIPGLENALRKMAPGEKQTVNVPAAEAYGDVDPTMVVEVPRAQFPKADVVVGDQFQAEGPDGFSQMVQVTAVSATHVTVDGNHPLAGQDLTFDVTLESAREATEQEVKHGHVHGHGGIVH